MKWQEREKGELCKDFAKFVESWEEYKTKIKCHYYEKTNRITIFDMSADGIKFSFRKVGMKYSLLFDGRCELIQEDTYLFFEGVCNQFIKQTKF